jgi:hypothetical protein
MVLKPCENTIRLLRCHTMPLSFLPCLNSISILACNDLDSRSIHYFVRLHLERRVLNDERPHIITETIGMKMSLYSSLLIRCTIEEIDQRHTLSVVFVLTCFTIVSARDLSN